MVTRFYSARALVYLGALLFARPVAAEISAMTVYEGDLIAGLRWHSLGTGRTTEDMWKIALVK